MVNGCHVLFKAKLSCIGAGASPSQNKALWVCNATPVLLTPPSEALGMQPAETEKLGEPNPFLPSLSPSVSLPRAAGAHFSVLGDENPERGLFPFNNNNNGNFALIRRWYQHHLITEGGRMWKKKECPKVSH